MSSCCFDKDRLLKKALMYLLLIPFEKVIERIDHLYGQSQNLTKTMGVAYFFNADHLGLLRRLIEASA